MLMVIDTQVPRSSHPHPDPQPPVPFFLADTKLFLVPRNNLGLVWTTQGNSFPFQYMISEEIYDPGQGRELNNRNGLGPLTQHSSWRAGPLLSLSSLWLLFPTNMMPGAVEAALDHAESRRNQSRVLMLLRSEPALGPCVFRLFSKWDSTCLNC